MKIRTFAAIGLTLIGAAFGGARPADAATNDCLKLYSTLIDIATGVSAFNTTIKVLRNDMELTRAQLKIILDVDESAKLSNETDAAVDKVSNQIAELTEPVPNISEVFSNVHNVAKTLDETALEPTSETLSNAVKDLGIKEYYERLGKVTKGLKYTSAALTVTGVVLGGIKYFTKTDCNIFYQSAGLREPPYGGPNDGLDGRRFQFGPAVVTPAVYRGEDRPRLIEAVFTKVKPGMEKKCRADAQKLIGDGLKLASAVDTAMHPVAIAASDLHSVLTKEVDPVLHPLTVVDKPIEAIHKSIVRVHDDLMEFRKLEKHVITIKIGGINIVHTSAEHVFKEWNKIVKTVEDTLHITEIKKLLEKELNALMRPVTRSVAREIKHLEKSVKIDGFSIADAKTAFAKVDKNLAEIKDVAGIDGFKTLHTRIQALEKSCGA